MQNAAEGPCAIKTGYCSSASKRSSNRWRNRQGPGPDAGRRAGCLLRQIPAVVSNPFPRPSNPPAEPVPPGLSPSQRRLAVRNGLKLWGYGEVYYTRPTHDEKQAQADLARAVFGIGYTFDSRTEFNSEFEVEHAVASATTRASSKSSSSISIASSTIRSALRAGLFLMPFGFLNEHHEPTNFYGVQRNFVETLIIPSTWREGGLNLHGDTGFGLAGMSG